MIILGISVILIGAILCYLCFRRFPRDISWIPAGIIFIAALGLGQSTIIASLKTTLDTSKMLDVLHTIQYINYAVILILISLSIAFVPKQISWLTCILLFVVCGGFDEGIHAEKRNLRTHVSTAQVPDNPPSAAP
jgi:hypothetical protein